MIISVEGIPIRLIDRRQKIPDHVANTIKVLQIIRRFGVDFLVRYVFRHKVEGLFNVLQIQCNVFDQAVKGDGLEVSTL